MPDTGRLPAREAPQGLVSLDNSANLLEWPTWLLAASVYGGWIVLTWFFGALPWWATLAAGAWLVAWQNSFQHEALHGHPSPSGRLNDALAWPPLGLWMPYAIYRDSHRAHHETPSLTDPLDDPESYYVTPEHWARYGRIQRAVLWLNNTLAGRLVLGPWLVATRFWWMEAKRMKEGDFGNMRIWIIHLVLVAALLLWVTVICGISVAEYLLFFAWPGLALSLMRSFHEHRPADSQSGRTAIVEAGPLAGLLYLNNNLHVVHHDRPGLPWYRIPALYQRDRTAILLRNGGFRYGGGYLEIALRYGLRPKDSPVHPG